MSIAVHDHQHDAVSRIPVCGYDVTRYGSDNRTNAFSSSYSIVFINSSVESRTSSFHHPYITVMKVSGCDMLYVPPIYHVSFPATKTHRPHSTQVTGSSHLSHSTSAASCHSNMLPSTSHLSKPCRSIQLFIKSIRNTTISIHIDSTSSISDLKHLIYAHDGIPPCDLRLLFRGRELRDDALLSDLDVDGATITCLLRVLGGRPYHRIPLRWWFGFSRSYEDGRAGEEGRICHALSEIVFGGACPANWYSDAPLCDWYGITLHSCSVLIDCLYIAR